MFFGENRAPLIARLRAGVYARTPYGGTEPPPAKPSQPKQPPGCINRNIGLNYNPIRVLGTLVKPHGA